MNLFPRYDGPPLIDQACSVENLTNAWPQVRGNIHVGRRHRSAGVDTITVQDFERDWTTHMDQLRQELRSGRYRSLPARLVRIPKRQWG